MSQTVVYTRPYSSWPRSTVSNANHRLMSSVKSFRYFASLIPSVCLSPSRSPFFSSSLPLSLSNSPFLFHICSSWFSSFPTHHCIVNRPLKVLLVNTCRKDMIRAGISREPIITRLRFRFPEWAVAEHCVLGPNTSFPVTPVHGAEDT